MASASSVASSASALVIVLSILTLLGCQNPAAPPPQSSGADQSFTSIPPSTSASAPTLKLTPTPAPPPIATPIQKPAPTLVHAPTPLPPTGTPGVDCGPNCSWDFVPAVTSVEWIDLPTVSGNGNLTLKVKVGEKDRMTFPNQAGGGASNIALTNGGSQLYGMVIPPAPPGMTWNPTPGQWTADTYHLRARIFTVSARIDARTASQQDLTLCLWTGGQGSANRVLACIPVTRP